MDIFHGRALSPAGPATDIMPVTPNDAADLAITASALFIEIGGLTLKQALLRLLKFIEIN